MPEANSALPAVMQERKLQLVDSEGEQPTPPTPPAAQTPPEGNETKVTISRDEFNDLQAAAGKARAAEGRAESLALDLDALKRRLTEVETAAKGNGDGGAKPPQTQAAWEPFEVAYSEQENDDYGESKPFVVKAVKEVLNGVVPKILDRIAALEKTLSDVKGVAEGASQTATSVKANTYNQRVKEKVREIGGDFEACVNHKNWSDFLQSIDSDTGYSYAELIRMNVNKENVAGMVRVFSNFMDQYGLKKNNNTTGYEGAVPTGATPVNDGPKEPEMLAFSERKEAHKKFISHEISYEEYDKIAKKFEQADREGRVDYTK